MSKPTVKHELQLDNLPPLSVQHRAELDALSKSGESIDYSDASPLPAEFWKSAVRNPFYRPTKTSTTVRVDSDVLAWLKSQGKGYQTRLNEILRAAMLKEVGR